MKNLQKGFANIVLIVVIVAIVAVGGYFVFSKKSQQPKNEPISTTTNLQTYKNDKYGFELNYPNGYSATENKTGVSITSSQSCQKILGTGGGQWPKDCFIYDLLIQKNKIEGGSAHVPSNKIAGYSSEKFELDGGMYDNLNQIYIQFKKGDNWYISYVSYHSENKTEAENLLNQILSTFKFAEPTAKVDIKATNPVLQKVEKVVIDFLNARKQRDFNQAKPFLTSELAKTIDPVEFAGVSNPHISRFEIVNSQFMHYGETCLVETKVYYEYTGQGETGSETNRYYVTCNPEGTAKYLIEAFPYVPPFNTASIIPVKVFFEKGELQTFPVTRYIPQTSQVAKATLEVLLLGLSDAEMDSGYFNELPIGSKLKSLSIVEGEARPDFTGRIQAGGGSSSMGIRVEQITKTLLQFSTIKTVKISVEGSSADIFQP